MQPGRALLFFSLVLVFGSSKVWAKGRKPPDSVYPPAPDQSIEQLLKESPPAPEVSPPPTAPAPNPTSELPAEAPSGEAPVKVTTEPAARGEVSPPTLRGRTEVGGGGNSVSTPPSRPSPSPPLQLGGPANDSVVGRGEGVLNLPEHYTVWIWQENGDCLWRIAEKIYGDRDKWRLIYLANRDVIRDPNKIYPRQKLRIPPVDWQP